MKPRDLDDLRELGAKYDGEVTRLRQLNGEALSCLKAVLPRLPYNKRFESLARRVEGVIASLERG